MNAFKPATRQKVLPVPEQVGYEVDAFGNVYSMLRGERRRLRPGRAKAGYLTVVLHGKTYPIHKLMQMVFLPHTVGLLVMNHKDGCKQNNRLENLEAITIAQNNQHAWDCGLRGPNGLRGETIGTSKLTALQVEAIRIRLSNGERCSAIGADFQVSASTISKIKTGHNWAHIR